MSHVFTAEDVAELVALRVGVPRQGCEKCERGPSKSSFLGDCAHVIPAQSHFGFIRLCPECLEARPLAWMRQLDEAKTAAFLNECGAGEGIFDIRRLNRLELMRP